MARKIVTQDDIKDLSVSGGGHQIFEIFSTLRKDANDIDGAYPCDGREFSKSDFTGGNNPYDMLLLNKAKTLSYEEWNTEVTAKGVCFSFALDEENEKFKIPKLINDTIPTLTGTVGDVGKSDVANTGSGRNIGETVFSLIPLSDAGLHLLDGSLLQVGGIYDSFITHVASLQTAYPGLFVTEENWQSSVSTYGVCGKFVYTEGVSLRLPKVTGFVEGTLDSTALGDLVEAGLPNITGESNIGGNAPKTVSSSGALKQVRYQLNAVVNATSSDISDLAQTILDASLSNSIYGKSTTVQPQAVKGYLYMVVATATKTDIQVNIDNIATDLNGKAGVDLTNVNTAGKAVIANLGMPSDKWVGLSIPVSMTQLTMPADGYLYSVIFASSSAMGMMNMMNGTGFGNMKQVPANSAEKMYLPVRKGDVVTVEYSNLAETTTMQFYYTEGSKS